MLLERVNTQADFEAALGTILQSTNGNGQMRNGREFNYLLQKWSTIDPKAALAFVQGIENGGARMGGMNAVLQAWTKRNPQEAVAWAKANGATPENGNPALMSVIGQLAKTDAMQALQLTQTENAGNMRWVAGGVVNQLISQRGEEAARDAVMTVADEGLRNSMLRQLAGKVAGTDPQKAVGWVTSMPDGEVKSAALADVIGQWVQKDAQAAAMYMTKLPVGEATDAPRARFARSITKIDPAAAADWASSISNSETRMESLSAVVGNWMQTDSDAAKQWVENSQFPARTKKQILSAATAPKK
jgi:hypothetical protein